MYESDKGGIVWYRSSWELAAIKFMDKDKDTDKFIYEPFSINYEYDSKNHKYWPDFQQFLKNGQVKIIEVRPKFKCKDEISQAKFKAAREYVAEHNMTFEVWDERRK